MQQTAQLLSQTSRSQLLLTSETCLESGKYMNMHRNFLE